MASNKVTQKTSKKASKKTSSSTTPIPGDVKWSELAKQLDDPIPQGVKWSDLMEEEAALPKKEKVSITLTNSYEGHITMSNGRRGTAAEDAIVLVLKYGANQIAFEWPSYCIKKKEIKVEDNSAEVSVYNENDYGVTIIFTEIVTVLFTVLEKSAPPAPWTGDIKKPMVDMTLPKLPLMKAPEKAKITTSMVAKVFDDAVVEKDAEFFQSIIHLEKSKKGFFVSTKKSIDPKKMENYFPNCVFNQNTFEAGLMQWCNNHTQSQDMTYMNKAGIGIGPMYVNLFTRMYGVANRDDFLRHCYDSTQ
jgi:hypothetical protein